jgi:NitT/TauT family transport system substrate-binding protein
VGAPNTAFPALTNGQVDLVMSFSPMDGMCDVLKACRVVVDPRIGEGSPKVLATRGGAGSLMVNAAWAEANPATVVAIRKMLAMADAYTHDPANFSNVLAVLKATFGLKLPKADEIAEAILMRSISTMHAQGSVTAMQAVADYMFDNKQLPSRPDMAAIVLP